MLALWQDAVFVMIMGHEERHRDNQPFHGIVQGKGAAVLVLQLETTAAEIASVEKLRKSPIVHDCASCGRTPWTDPPRKCLWVLGPSSKVNVCKLF